MKTKLINDRPENLCSGAGERDEAVSSVEDFARKNGIAAAQLTGIGAFSDARSVPRLGDEELPRRFRSLSRWRSSHSLATSALGPMEAGAASIRSAVSRADGIAMGGDLLKAHVRPTLEVVLT